MMRILKVLGFAALAFVVSTVLMIKEASAGMNCFGSGVEQNSQNRCVVLEPGTYAVEVLRYGDAMGFLDVTADGGRRMVRVGAREVLRLEAPFALEAGSNERMVVKVERD